MITLTNLTFIEEEAVSIQKFLYTNYQTVLLDIQFDRLSGRISHEEYQDALESAEFSYRESLFFLQGSVMSDRLPISFIKEESIKMSNVCDFKVETFDKKSLLASCTYQTEEGSSYSTEAVSYEFTDGKAAIFFRSEYGSLFFKGIVPTDKVEDQLNELTHSLFDKLISKEKALSHLVDKFSFHESFLPF